VITRGLIAATIIILLCHGTVFSQEDSGSAGGDIGFSLGLAEYQVREEVLNNIRHRGTLVSGGVFYERTSEVARQKYEFHLIFSMLKSRYDPDKASFAVNPSFNYRYARKVKSINPRLALYLGGIIGLDMHHEWFDNWDDSHLYWLTSYYLGIDGILTYQKSADNSFIFEIYAPVAALVSRPPERFLYKVANPEFSWAVDELHSDLRFTSTHEHVVLNMNLGYSLRYTDRFEQRIYWRSCYTKSMMPYSKDITILTHAIGASFVF
jgi:hypothetical protein